VRAIWAMKSFRRWLWVAAALCTANAAADDSQRLEERLPTVAEPPADAAAPAPPPSAASETDFASFRPFTLRFMTVEGATVVSVVEIQTCAAGLIGKTVGPIELVDLTQCITRLYRNRDYFLSRAIVPPQQVVDGVLRVRIIEGYIAAVVPTGIEQVDADAHFAATLNERPSTLSTFERGLLLLADRYGYRVTKSELASDPNDPARYTFNVTVSRSPLAFRLYGDNRGTEPHGPEQAFAWVAWHGVFGPTDRLAASLFVTPTSIREILYADLNYAHAWAKGELWTEFGASISRTHDGSVPSILGERSDTDRLYGRVTIPIVRTRAQSLWTGLLLDARHSEQPLSGVDEDTRVLRATATYTLVDGPTRADALLELSQGVDAFGASENRDADLSRADARAQFTKARLDVSLLRKMSPQWDLLLMAAGQWADGALVASEEFGGGGARFGRAYDYSEITGDHGIAGGAELRWTSALALASFQVFGFADAARVWNIGSDPAQVGDADLTSAGGGLRLLPFGGVSASVEVAKPVSRDVAAEGDRSPRVFVTISGTW
jgi:hemolysin activation/secretion protein